MAEFAWNSRKSNRVMFESQASFRLHRVSKKEVRLNTETVAAKLVDLSLGGCGLESPTFVPVGTKLNVFLDRNLFLEPGAKGSLRHFSKILAIVRNSRQLPNRAYRLGVQFEKVDAKDKKMIQAFVDRNERREEKRVSFPAA